MIPGDKGDLRAAVAPAWPHGEVVASDQPLGPLLALTIHNRNAVLTLVAMDEEQVAPLGINGRSGSSTERRRNWPWRATIEILAE